MGIKVRFAYRYGCVKIYINFLILLTFVNKIDVDKRSDLGDPPLGEKLWNGRI